MKYSQKAILSVLLLTLSACAIFIPPKLTPGETEAEVVAKLGKPTARIPDSNGFLLEYTRNPWGQATNMARFDSNGRLVSYEQVLTVENFATIKPGVATKADVLRAIGHPSDTSYLSRLQLEVWAYPYKESNVWNSVMYVHFDNNGIVKLMQNGPDMRFERDGRL
jgi:outer membrane protein assembly factor BamE (lipoprotein component of BamABCDE complex)